MPTTLGARLDGRDNALNFLRLVLAVFVIVGHAGPGVLEGLSGLAVNGFFALSGFLIAGSRMRLTMYDFVLRRCLRILPGFWACLVVTAFVFAPLSSMFAGHYDLRSAVGYVGNNIGLTMNQWLIGDTLAGVPGASAWDGSLWTLEFEFAAYLAAALLLSLTLVRRHLAVVLVAAALLTIALQPLAHGPLNVSTNMYLEALRLAGFFLVGMAVWALRHRMPVRADLMVAAFVITVVVYVNVGDFMFHVLLALPLSYLLLTLGATLPVRMGAVNDVSYGVYIYAPVVTNILIQLGAQDFGILPSAALTLAFTLPCAWASWLLVERPALGLAKRMTRERPAARVSQPA